MRTPEKTPTHQYVQIRLPVDLKRQLEAMAHAGACSFTQLVRDVLRAFVDAQVKARPDGADVRTMTDDKRSAR